MKTPREILLKKHQAVQPKLDRLRRDLMEQGVHQETAAPALLSDSGERELPLPRRTGMSALRGRGVRRFAFHFIGRLWEELILPARGIWSGLAATWIIILAIGLVDSETEPAAITTTAQNPRQAPEVMGLIQARQRLLVEFLGENAAREPAEPTRSTFHPRSERRTEFRVA